MISGDDPRAQTAVVRLPRGRSTASRWSGWTRPASRSSRRPITPTWTLDGERRWRSNALEHGRVRTPMTCRTTRARHIWRIWTRPTPTTGGRSSRRRRLAGCLQLRSAGTDTDRLLVRPGERDRMVRADPGADGRYRGSGDATAAEYKDPAGLQHQLLGRGIRSLIWWLLRRSTGLVIRHEHVGDVLCLRVRWRHRIRGRSYFQFHVRFLGSRQWGTRRICTCSPAPTKPTWTR